MNRRVEMPSGNALKRTPAAVCIADHSIEPTRRDMLVAPFLAALPLVLLGARVRAGQIDRAETAITPSDAIEWSAWSGGPPIAGKWRRCMAGWTHPGRTSC